MIEQRSSPHRDWLCFVAITAFAFAVRYLYLLQARDCPMFSGLVVDGASYGAWSDRIANGDFLGGEVFYQAPLYPYFLGVLKTLFGRDLWTLRLVQIALGASACGVLFLAGKRWFGRSAGIAAAILLALYPSAMFFDATIQKTCLAGLLTAVLLLALARARDQPSSKRFLLTGVVLGLLMLTREETILLVPALAIFGWLAFRSTPFARRARFLGAFAAGLALMLLPVALRNAAVGGEFVLTTAQAGPNFYIGNHAGADGTYTPLRPGRGDAQYERQDAVQIAEREAGRALSPSEVSRHWFAKSFAYVTNEPLDYARLLVRKARLLVSDYEVPDAEDIYFYERYASVLRWLGAVWSFGLLVPLAAAGVALTWARRRELAALYLVLGTTAAGVVLFYVFARYRYTLVPELVLFAGAAVVESAALVRVRRWRNVAIVTVIFALFWCASNLNPPWRKDQGLASSYQNSGLALVQQGDLPRAVESFLESTKLQPNAAEAWANLGFALLQSKRFDEAAAAFAQELTLEPFDRARCETRLGSALAQGGHPEDGVAHLDAALVLEPRRVEALDLRATTNIRLDRWSAAIADLRKIAAVMPTNRDARGKLSMLLAAAPDDRARNGREALAIAESLLAETGGRDPRIVDLRAVALAELGRFDDAVAMLRPLVESGVAASTMRDHLALFEKRLPLRVAH